MIQIEIENALKDLNGLVMEGRVMEAFEKYYHDNVAMQENELPRLFQKKQTEKELTFLSNLVEFRKAEVKGIAIHGNLSYVIWTYDYTHKEWGLRNYTRYQYRSGRWKIIRSVLSI
jgi:hypothetical protein